jgi:ADP-dependent NAD(P)H-hydrate dehydratase / NAD(P)H-hydrate epimerase
MRQEGRVRPADAADVYGCVDVPAATAAESAAADAAARGAHGIAERVLMENAARTAALVVHAAHPRGRVAVLTGVGNNGGDGAILARLLHEWGRDAVIVHGGRAPRAELLNGVAVPLHAADAAARELAAADVLVDALLGTGAGGAPRGAIAGLIEAATHTGRPVVALDQPSGVDPTSGAVHEPAIRAELTVCFGWPKLGLLLNPARRQCGRLVAVEIGFPPAVAAGFGAALITPAWAQERLPARAPDAHKGTSGRLLLLAGGGGMGGAAILSARAAIAAGVGLVRVVADAANHAALHAAVPEAVVTAFDAFEPGAAADAHAVAAGPGLGTGDESRGLLRRVLDATGSRAALLDADALNLFAQEPDALAALAAGRPLVLTPHPGELGRLLGCETGDITRDPVAAARAAATRFGCTVLLKGQPSLVASPAAPLLVATTGSSDLATAGMGDHLTGVIAALLAAGAAPRDAAAVGLHFSGRAADLAGYGRSLTPSVASRALRRAIRSPGAAAPPWKLPFVRFDQPPRW